MTNVLAALTIAAVGVAAEGADGLAGSGTNQGRRAVIDIGASRVQGASSRHVNAHIRVGAGDVTMTVVAARILNGVTAVGGTAKFNVLSAGDDIGTSSVLRTGQVGI